MLDKTLIFAFGLVALTGCKADKIEIDLTEKMELSDE